MCESLIKTLFYENPIYADMFNKLTELVYIFDTNGCVVFFNTAAENFENLKNEDVMGLHINDIYKQDYSPSLKALETGHEVVETDNIYMINGRQFRQVTKAYPIFYNNEIIGVYTIQTDITSLEKILKDNIRLQTNAGQQKEFKKASSFDTIVGIDPAFLKCVDLARAAATNNSAVLLSGPTGSGKEVFAKSIHNASERKDKPYLAINCAAIPETLLESILFGTVKGSFTGAMDKRGLFEQAKGGTLFLDELNSMSLNSQAKLLRVLEEKEFRYVGGDKDIKTDVRIISSINCTPMEAIEKNMLREDLFYRLSVVNIMIPPLCQRKKDILLLAKHFINKFNAKRGIDVKGLDSEVTDFFLAYTWPGNVRQIKHTIESAMNLADSHTNELSLNLLPQYLFEDDRIFIEPLKVNNNIKTKETDPEPNASDNVGDESDIFEIIREKEKKEIIEALFMCNGNVSKTARFLNIHRQSLIHKMKKHNIKNV